MRRFDGILVLLLSAVFLATACGGSSPDSEGTATPEIVLNLPAEFSTGETGRTVPSYVTGMFLTVTGDGMAPIKREFSAPGNGSPSQVTVTVTPGLRRFSVLITTSINKTFTGSTQVHVIAGENGTVVIDMVLNALPEVTLKASKTNVTPLQPVKLTATATDRDGDPLTFSWKASGGKLIGKGLNAGWGAGQPGAYTITFFAFDGRGGVGVASVKITVAGIALQALPGPANGLIDLNWNPLPSAASYVLHYGIAPGITAANPFTPGVTSPMAFNCGPYIGQTIYFRVTALDGAAGVISHSNEASALCPGSNAAPVVNSVTVSNPNPVVGETITLTCNATDPDGDPLTYWFSDGIAWGSAANPATWTLTATGTSTITCTATDPGGLTGAGSVGFTTGIGAPPLTATAGPAGTGKVVISWGIVPAATSYNVAFEVNDIAVAPCGAGFGAPPAIPVIGTSPAVIGSPFTTAGSISMPCATTTACYNFAATATDGVATSAIAYEPPTSNGVTCPGALNYTEVDPPFIDTNSSILTAEPSDAAGFNFTLGGGYSGDINGFIDPTGDQNDYYAINVGTSAQITFTVSAGDALVDFAVLDSLGGVLLGTVPGPLMAWPHGQLANTVVYLWVFTTNAGAGPYAINLTTN